MPSLVRCSIAWYRRESAAPTFMLPVSVTTFGFASLKSQGWAVEGGTLSGPAGSEAQKSEPRDVLAPLLAGGRPNSIHDARASTMSAPCTGSSVRRSPRRSSDGCGTHHARPILARATNVPGRVPATPARPRACVVPRIYLARARSLHVPVAAHASAPRRLAYTHPHVHTPDAHTHPTRHTLGSTISTCSWWRRRS